jgi:tRNA-uridine 2-sulfurtransferase
VRVLVAMSGGVDSSVAAALLLDAGHDVVGATMKLWGGPSDSGCCSVSDVDDARRVADQIGIVHHVFNFGADFDRDVVGPYVDAHAAGQTPNPCVACNRHIKFDRFARRAEQLGFDAIATGHHARVVADGEAGPWRLCRGADEDKDQSYVLHMLDQDQLSRLLLPVGEMTKAEVRSTAALRGLRTAAKPDSQDVCFISKGGGRLAFLADRVPLHEGRVVDEAGTEVGTVPAVELVTVGQRRALGNPGGMLPPGERRYAVAVDVPAGVVTVGPLERLLTSEIEVGAVTWTGPALAPGAAVSVQTSAHGCPVAGRWVPDVGGHPEAADGRVELEQQVRRVAAGQSVVLYDPAPGGAVLGGGIAR